MKTYETYVYHVYYGDECVRREYFHTSKEAYDYVAKQKNPLDWTVTRIIIPRSKNKKKGR